MNTEDEVIELPPAPDTWKRRTPTDRPDYVGPNRERVKRWAPAPDNAGKLSAVQFRMARAALGWTVREAAEKAGVHRNTVPHVEAGEAAHRSTTDALERAYTAAGVEFPAYATVRFPESA